MVDVILPNTASPWQNHSIRTYFLVPRRRMYPLFRPIGELLNVYLGLTDPLSSIAHYYHELTGTTVLLSETTSKPRQRSSIRPRRRPCLAPLKTIFVRGPLQCCVHAGAQSIRASGGRCLLGVSVTGEVKMQCNPDRRRGGERRLLTIHGSQPVPGRRGSVSLPRTSPGQCQSTPDQSWTVSVYPGPVLDSVSLPRTSPGQCQSTPTQSWTVSLYPGPVLDSVSLPRTSPGQWQSTPDQSWTVSVYPGPVLDGVTLPRTSPGQCQSTPDQSWTVSVYPGPVLDSVSLPRTSPGQCQSTTDQSWTVSVYPDPVLDSVTLPRTSPGQCQSTPGQSWTVSVYPGPVLDIVSLPRTSSGQCGMDSGKAEMNSGEGPGIPASRF